MAKKPKQQKEKPKPPKNNSPKRLLSWGAIGATLLLVFEYIGYLVSGLDMTQYLLKWRLHTLNFIVLGGFVFGLTLIIVLWQLFQRGNPYRYIWLAATVVIAVSGLVGWSSYIQSRQEKLIVLITAFEGPEDVYALRNVIVEKLNADFSTESQIQIETIDETITPDSQSGTPRARELGKSYQADVVIWGWYRSTENPNITVHIENLAPENTLPIDTSETLQPSVTLAELESFSFQQKAGSELSALISFLTGFVEYENNNYTNAVSRFNAATDILDSKTKLLESYSCSCVLFYRATANLHLGNYEIAVQDYSQYIELNPADIQSYNNRGMAYKYIKQYENALQDFDMAIKIGGVNIDWVYDNRGLVFGDLGDFQRAVQNHSRAIELNPNNAKAFSNRGFAYSNLGEFKNAIQDYDAAILINPKISSAYFNRALTYWYLGDYESAIQDYSKALEINPEYAIGYFGRGAAYWSWHKYDLAIQDFDMALKLNPEYVDAYYNRGLAYSSLGQYERAIEDYNQAIKLDPNDADAYNNRGVAYERLGKIFEAQLDFAKSEELDGSNKP
ncbi:MAG: tetratricopeptide repeat protein [Anaerolineales bacterium]|nr:tetratricopeptide repeat protein [Anaerolineales bacterium]